MSNSSTPEIPQVKLSVAYSVLEKNVLLPKISIEAIGISAINKKEIDTIVKHLDDFSEFIKNKLDPVEFGSDSKSWEQA